MSQLIRVNEEVYEKVKLLSSSVNKSISQLVADAIETYEREIFFKKMEAAYESLATDAIACAEEEGEQRLLDSSLMDGLSNE